MKRFLAISLLIIISFAFSAVIFPVKSATSEKPTSTPTLEEDYDFSSMTTYELFWPITAGKVPGDRFYNLKIWRDKLTGYLFFSPVKKSEYLKQLANKRLLEAEKLVELDRQSFLQETLEKSTKYMKDGLGILSSAEQTSESAWLEDEYAKDIQKHLIVLEKMKGRAEEKGVLEESIKSIRELIDKYELGGKPQV